MKTCPKCRQETPDVAQFCPLDGTSLGDGAPSERPRNVTPIYVPSIEHAPPGPAAASGAPAPGSVVAPMEERAHAVSGAWFGEGDAASRAVETPLRETGKLPAIYERFTEEEEPARRGLSRRTITLASLGGVVLLGIVVALAVGGRGSPPSAAPEARTPDNPLAPAVPSEAVRSPEPAPVAPAALPAPVFQPPAPARVGPEAPAVAKKSEEALPAPRAEERRRSSKSNPKSRSAGAPARKATATPVPRAAAGRAGAASPSASPASAASAEQADAHARAGREQLRHGNYSRAAEEFTRARQLDSTNAEATAGLGEVAFEQGYYGQAVERLRDAVRLRPRSVRYLVLLGNAYFKLGQKKSAIETYKRALEIDPAQEEARDGLRAAEK